MIYQRLAKVFLICSKHLRPARWERDNGSDTAERDPTISSELRWQDVTLPDSVSVADLDALIFSNLTSRFQKTAMVVGNAATQRREHGAPIDAKIIGARIGALAETGDIESAGDLRYGRHSEVRLKD